jgi:prolyl 4-hydroxylase
MYKKGERFMKRYIRSYDNVLQPDFCQHLIDIFEGNEQNHERYNLGRPSFTQLNFSDLESQYPDEHRRLISTAQEYYRIYLKQCNADYFPSVVELENFRIKRYLNNDIDQFMEHVDVANYESARRCLAFFWYLNDVRIGGETIFTNAERYSVQPRTGRLLIFPPLWMFPHIGAKPISGAKYLVGSYLHYA